MNALTAMESLPLAELRDPDATADFILWLGVKDRPGKPERKDTESDREYALRTFRHVKRQAKSEIIVTGLNKAAFYRQALSDGIQLICYRAWIHGWWVDTQDLGGTEEAFRQWVKDAVTAEGASRTEAWRLANTILNLYWLKQNGYQGLPEDLEDIFRDRELFNRYARKVAEIGRYIQAIEDWEEPEEEDEEESGLEKLESYIEQAIQDINNPEKGTDDLDKPVGKQEAPPAIIHLSGYDQLGRTTFEGTATPTQLHRLKRATRQVAEWRLKGETYGITEEFVLVRYRFHKDSWACQAWSNELGWSDFEECEEPHLNGNQEGVPLVDTELGLTYIAQWEEL